MIETATKVKERPILFSAEMVKAILAGRKTQTRRVMKGRLLDWWNAAGWGREDGMPIAEDDQGDVVRIPCPYGQPGDRLWVKESYAIESNCDIDDEEFYPPPFDDGRPIRRVDNASEGKFWEQCHYRATDLLPDLACEHPSHDGGEPCPHPWKSPRFMPRWASRIMLEIVNVRVERVQEISEEGAKAEGSFLGRCQCMPRSSDRGIMANFSLQWCHIHGQEFRKLWDSINSKRGYGWDTNCWVWAIEFKRREET